MRFIDFFSHYLDFLELSEQIGSGGKELGRQNFLLLLDVMLDIAFTFFKNFIDNGINFFLKAGELVIQNLGHLAMENINFVIDVRDFGLNFY